MRHPRSSDAMLTALPLAAGFTVQLASWLPVRFSYRENSLGIVSLATLRRYPLQQESFWLVFAALALGLLAWALSRALRPAGAPPGSQATAFAFAVLGLLLALWLPGAAGALACAAAAAVALGWVRRAGSFEAAFRGAARARASHVDPEARAPARGRRAGVPAAHARDLDGRLERRLRHTRRPARLGQLQLPCGDRPASRLGGRDPARRLARPRLLLSLRAAARVRAGRCLGADASLDRRLPPLRLGRPRRQLRRRDPALRSAGAPQEPRAPAAAAAALRRSAHGSPARGPARCSCSG